jgi:hypothetical protein
LKIVDRALQAIAVALAVSLVVAAWHDVSQAYDVWYYHVPFAGRLVGLVDPKSYVFSADNQARFGGFPLFGELLQGIAWRLTGHVAATNLVALGALFGLAAFLWRLFAVPLHLSLIALLAIPLVMTHATSSYVDLPSNACVTMLCLCVVRAWTTGPSRGLLIGAGLLAAAAANMKFQLVPIVTIASGALFVIALRHGGRRMLPLLAFLPLVFATPIKNAVVHGNPVWPIELEVLGHSFPHVEEAYGSSPRHLEHASRPVRFVRSALEIDNRPIASQRRWSVDQWTPPDEPGYRMGGYFGAYVFVNLAALGWALRTRKKEAIVFAGVTLVAAFVPQSHELRYYMHWMMLLVALNLVFWAPKARLAASAIALAALAVVTWSTDAAYLYASGSTFDELVGKRVDRSIIDAAMPGERLCIARQPFNFLYAPMFHTERSYIVEECTR